MTARFIVADVFDGLASLESGSVDLVVTSPPFLALRSYLPADHADKSKEIGSEATPAEFIDTLLRVTAELRRVLAPHGSICVELGDTYAGSGGGGGDYLPGGWREGQQQFAGSEASMKESNAAHWRQKNQHKPNAPRERQGIRSDGKEVYQTDAASIVRNDGGAGWPLNKSRTLIPSLYEIALAYGFNPLTGQTSPAGQWRIRNVVTWARPNPPVGALGDKWRPATSDLIIACTSPKRYWDDLATRKPALHPEHNDRYAEPGGAYARKSLGRTDRETMLGPSRGAGLFPNHTSGAPLLDYWVIPPGGYTGSHYAVFPEELVVPCVQAMCPQRVCQTCGEPSRRIVEVDGLTGVDFKAAVTGSNDRSTGLHGPRTMMPENIERKTLGWTDCGHSVCPTCRGSGWMPYVDNRRRYGDTSAIVCADCINGRVNNWRPGLVLDPFAGSGTTLAVATGHGHDAIGIDIDSRNADLARDRVGPFLFDQVGKP